MQILVLVVDDVDDLRVCVCVCIRCVRTYIFRPLHGLKVHGSFLGVPAATSNVIRTFKQIHGKHNDKATKQGFDLLNKDRQSFCICGTHF